MLLQMDNVMHLVNGNTSYLRVCFFGKIQIRISNPDYHFPFFWANPKMDLESERSKLKKDFLD